MQALIRKQSGLSSRARAQGKGIDRSICNVRCSSSTSTDAQATTASRRDALLLGTASLMTVPLVLTNPASATDAPSGSKYNVKYLPVDKLGSFQKADQRKEFVDRAEKAILEVLTASDAPACVRLALLDAGSYDLATKIGGVSGAVASQPPDDVRPVVEKLRQVKQTIDEGDTNGAGPISWADLIYLAGKATTQASWREAKRSKGSERAAAQGGNPWPVTIGRVDAEGSGESKVPSRDASVEDITQYLKALASKGESGPFAPKPPFWEKPGFLIWTAGAVDPAAEEERFAKSSPVYADIKRGYDMSRDTISRTDYEVDFAAVYNKLTGLGATIDPKAYLYPQPVLNPKL